MKHKDPDYSCAYVILKTAKGTEGHGLTFTCGRGTEIVVAAIKSLSELVVGQTAIDIFKDFGGFWRSLTSETQLRWVLSLLMDFEKSTQVVFCFSLDQKKV